MLAAPHRSQRRRLSRRHATAVVGCPCCDVNLAALLAEPEEPGRREAVQAALRRWKQAMAEAIYNFFNP